MLTGNKGEWSEIYTLLKIVGDKVLVPGNADLERITGLLFPIVKVLREESDNVYTYEYKDNLVLVTGGDNAYEIPISEFRDKAVTLLREIKDSSGSTFPVPDLEAFINLFGCRSLKARSSSKSDIRVVIHDIRSSSSPELGFSIKSQLGGASTLLNAGHTTNFVYRLVGPALSAAQVDTINAIDTRSKIVDRITAIRALDNSLKFVHVANPTFENNLILIDSRLPEIVAELVLRFYSSKTSRLADLLASVAAENPLGFNTDCDHPYYSYKVKRFLTDIALGMMPSKMWTGELHATGGYLIVKEDGEVLCYHIYNRNSFEDYLLNNTRLETASSSRHGFGSVYSESGEPRVKLNLQIRFV